jgi:hypothetical protein
VLTPVRNITRPWAVITHTRRLLGFPPCIHWPPTATPINGS